MNMTSNSANGVYFSESLCAQNMPVRNEDEPDAKTAGNTRVSKDYIHNLR